MNIASFNTLFQACIVQYHLTDNVDTPLQNPYEEGTIQGLLFKKNWIDVVQWHLEDLIRAEGINPIEALQIKRRIDHSNQDRTDLVEQIDELVYADYANVAKQKNARVNTETPAWAIDRLSILNIKLYHMQEETVRTDATPAHIEKCKQKFAVLQQQEIDLTIAIQQLVTELKSGACIVKTYKQMKMYNDPSLNPILRKEKGL